MTHAADLPAWAEVLTGMLLLLGAGLALTGSLGCSGLATYTIECTLQPSAPHWASAAS